MNESDIGDLFAAPVVFDDADAFETRTTRKLRLRLWLRQWLVVMAGLIGGVYALFQFVRVPDGGPLSVKQAQTQTDQLIDQAGHQLSTLTTSGVRYLDLVQQPMVFWAAFALCLTLLGLYYAYSREESL
jgi:hypothetical protein